MNRFIKNKAPKNEEVVTEIVGNEGNQLKVDKDGDVTINKDEIEQVVADEQITPNEPTIKNEKEDEVPITPTTWHYKNFTIEGSFQKLNKDSIVSRKIVGGAEYSDPLFDALRQCINTDPRCILDNIKIKQPNGGTQLIIIGTNYNDKHCSIEAILNNPNEKIQHIVRFFKEKFKRIVETNDFTKEYFI